MEPITAVEEARRIIQSYQGRPEDFQLPISDRLHDPIGMNVVTQNVCEDVYYLHTQGLWEYIVAIKI